jgi:hypothetical protein
MGKRRKNKFTFTQVEDFTLPSDYSKDNPSRPTASSSASINANPSIKVNATASR